MKNIRITVLLIAVIVLASLVGCAKKNTVTTTTTPTVTTAPTTDPRILSFPEMDYQDAKAAREFYRDQISSREYFTPEEEAILREKGYEIRGGYRLYRYDSSYHTVKRYDYPMVFRYRGDLFLWYLDQGGDLRFEAVVRDMWAPYLNPAGYVHFPEEHSGLQIYRSAEEGYLYSPQQGKVEIFRFGELISEVEIPEGAIYCGHSKIEGYVFRVGGDVYVMNYDSGLWKVLPIAHGVSAVITADYSLSSDPWSQPLFLMQDGQILAYCSWEGDPQAPSDDPSHLVAPRYEGGYLGLISLGGNSYR